MNIKNCPRCKKLFSPISRSLICPECEKKEEEDFDLVKAYLRENRGADIKIVAEETGVSIKKILQYLKQGRLEVTAEMGDFLKCEKCGVSIKSGQYCSSCNQKMIETLKTITKSIYEKNTEIKESNAKMHTRIK